MHCRDARLCVFARKPLVFNKIAREPVRLMVGGNPWKNDGMIIRCTETGSLYRLVC